MSLISIILFLSLMEQKVNYQVVVPCTTDSDCLAKNPHISFY